MDTVFIIIIIIYSRLFAEILFMLKQYFYLYKTTVSIIKRNINGFCLIEQSNIGWLLNYPLPFHSQMIIITKIPFTCLFANRYVKVIKVISSKGNLSRIDCGICWLRHGIIWGLSPVWEWSLRDLPYEWELSLFWRGSLQEREFLTETGLN